MILSCKSFDMSNLLSTGNNQSDNILVISSSNAYNWGVIMSYKFVDNLTTQNNSTKFFTLSMENPLIMMYNNYTISIKCFNQSKNTEIPDTIHINVENIITNSLIPIHIMNIHNMTWTTTHEKTFFIPEFPIIKININNIDIIFDFISFDL